ncbi:MAG: HEPN domain-containing protein [Acidobacteriota bacterium]
MLALILILSPLCRFMPGRPRRYRWREQQTDLAAARSLLALGHLRVAVSRAYYAIFHSACAALLWVGVEHGRHSGAQSEFGEFLVKPGILEPEFGRLYVKAREAREEQEYDLDAAPLAAQDAVEIVDDAERFVSRIAQYLQQAGAV